MAACGPVRAQASLGMIAVTRDGALWTHQLPDGKTQQLLRGGALSAPRFSQSGRWLSYREGDELWVVPAAGGQAKHIVTGMGKWAPASDILAVETSAGDLQIFAAGTGWKGQTLVHDVSGFAWSAKGESLAYGSEHGDDDVRTGLLSRVGLDGKDVKALTSEKGSGLEPYAWTRDGKEILYWVDEDFSASAASDGLPLFRVAAGGGTPFKLGISVLLKEDMLTFSPAGNSLVAAAGEGRETWTGKRIAVAELGGWNLRYLTGTALSATSPAWSPDGARVAFSAAPDAGNLGGGDAARDALAQRRIWVTGQDGAQDATRITGDDLYRDEHPIWSPDGKYLLFGRMDREGRGALWLMRADGSDPKQVSDVLRFEDDWFGYYGHIDWRNQFDWYQ
jgi:WD40 repeat protein